MTSNKGVKVIFLDRDGTINIDHGFVHKKEDWEFTPQAPEALRMMKEAGYKLGIVTNQSGIAAGLYTEEDMIALHKYMQEELAKEHASVDAIAYCPHARDGSCHCRKPETGMAHQIEKVLGPIDYTNSWTIGDKAADLMFGHALGTRTILLKSRYWEKTALPVEPDAIVSYLKDAVDIIKGK